MMLLAKLQPSSGMLVLTGAVDGEELRNSGRETIVYAEVSSQCFLLCAYSDAR